MLALRAALAVLWFLTLQDTQAHHRRHRHHSRRLYDHSNRGGGGAPSSHSILGRTQHGVLSQREDSFYGNRLAEAESPKTVGSRWSLKAHEEPAAINNTLSNVTAQLGGTAFLPCRVGHLGDRQISWIRRRDWHVLTSADVLYTHDRRFSVLHVAGSQDWTLHVKYVEERDEGTYECQVSTGTGIISLFVNLRVVIPEARIPGQGHYHVNRGSPITLTCIITKSPTPPQYVLWYHNGELLNYLRNKPEVAISMEVRSGGVRSVSRLEVGSACDRHSGNYTCGAPNTRPAWTMVFVTEGDKTAAVQRIDSLACRMGPVSPILMLISILAVR